MSEERIEVFSPSIKRREMSAVLTALVEDNVGPGDGALQFLTYAKEKLGFDYALSLRSPATALTLALSALSLEAGAGVLISALSPVYYLAVLSSLGLKPVLADVNEVGFFVDEASLQKVSEPYAAVVLYHPLGLCAPHSAFNGICVPIIEDISASYGSSFACEAAEGATDVAAESDFAPCFTLLGLEERDFITAGGGALLYAHDKRCSQKLKSTSIYGAAGAPILKEYALPDMNAAMAQVQMREAAKNIKKRAEIAAVYASSAMNCRHKMPFLADNFAYNHYAFPMILETGLKDVKAYASKHGVSCESAFQDTAASVLERGEVQEKAPAAYSLSLRTALFPLHPRLLLKDVGRVARVIRTLP